MIKNNKVIIFLLIAALSLTFLYVKKSHRCKNNNRELFYDAFPVNISLTGEVIDSDSAMLRYPFRIRHQDSLAVVMDLHHPEYFYHSFTYPEFRYISSFGKRGQAPGENLSIENFRFAGGAMWGLDANKHLIKAISIQNIYTETNTKEIPLNKEIVRALDFVLYGDSCFIIPDYSGNHRFHIIDKSGNIKSSHGEIPTLKHNSRNIALAQAWRSFLDYNPDNGILAMVTQLGEALEIYNLKDGGHVVKYGPHGEPGYQEVKGMAIPSGIMGFSDIQVTGKYIYAVFHGRSFKEIAKQPEPAIDGGQYIYVFSIKGEPLVRYTLDRYIYGMEVNEETKEIYAVDVNSNLPVVKFKLTRL